MKKMLQKNQRLKEKGKLTENSVNEKIYSKCELDFLVSKRAVI